MANGNEKQTLDLEALSERLASLEKLLQSSLAGPGGFAGPLGGGLGGISPVQQPSPLGFEVGDFLRDPQLQSPRGASFAPSGPNINFGGGSPFPVNEQPATIVNGLILGTRLLKALKKLNTPKPGGPSRA